MTKCISVSARALFCVAALALAGCSPDPTPDAQQSPEVSAVTPPTETPKTNGAATADQLARLDALVAETRRAETEYKDAERVASRQTAEAAKLIPLITEVTPLAVAPLAVAAIASSVAATVGSADAKNEDWWRSRALPLQRQRDSDMRSLAAAQMHFDSLPDQARGILGVPVVDAWMKARTEIARLTAIVATDRQAVKDFEEDARRAGVPPGWLREK